MNWVSMHHILKCIRIKLNKSWVSTVSTVSSSPKPKRDFDLRKALTPSSELKRDFGLREKPPPSSVPLPRTGLGVTLPPSPKEKKDFSMRAKLSPSPDPEQQIGAHQLMPTKDRGEFLPNQPYMRLTLALVNPAWRWGDSPPPSQNRNEEGEAREVGESEPVDRSVC